MRMKANEIFLLSQLFLDSNVIKGNKVSPECQKRSQKCLKLCSDLTTYQYHVIINFPRHKILIKNYFPANSS